MSGSLIDLVSAELDAPLPDPIRHFGLALSRRARRPPVAVLFYGSVLRTGDLSGILDFYVVVEHLADWSHGRLAAAANRALPPNVEYHEATIGGVVLRAKVAILSLRQFERLVRADSLDNSVWARFSQPAAVVWARNADARRAVADAIGEAVATAVTWAIRLGPAQAKPADFWRDLFRRTYRAELRVEKAGRSDEIVDRAPERFDRLFRAACAAKGLTLEDAGEGRVRVSGPRPASSAAGAWRRRSRLAKPLNLARLLKAAFTFQGGSDYLAWKASRHSGIAITLTERQRRHPLLAFLVIARRLRRRRRASD